MTDENDAAIWAKPAQLQSASMGFRRGSRAPAAAETVLTGSVADLVRHVREQDPDDLWRYTIVVDDTPIRNAELRQLLRRDDLPEA